MLQVMFPGMLTIVRIDDFDDIGGKEIMRVLPSGEWVTRHWHELAVVLAGEPDKPTNLEQLQQKCKEESISMRIDNSSYAHQGYYSESDSPKDLTACDKECGY